ncbi:hypothetical protein, partial [Legionella drancourtii]|uniref:hypothetical protein n=1 Tax=Legionella drancourtii TaxID=168933 RepID=UPI00058D22CB
MPKLPNKSLSDYLSLLQSIKDSTRRAEILCELEAVFPGLIKSAEDVASLLLRLSHQERISFYERFKHEIAQHVSTLKDMHAFAFLLSNEQAKELYNDLKKRGTLNVSTLNDYKQLLNSIQEPTLRAEILGQLEAVFPSLIKSAEDVEGLLLR